MNDLARLYSALRSSLGGGLDEVSLTEAACRSPDLASLLEAYGEGRISFDALVGGAESLFAPVGPERAERGSCDKREGESDMRYQPTPKSPVERTERASVGLSDVPTPTDTVPVNPPMDRRSLLGTLVRGRVPVYVWGGKGCGKSRAVREVAEGLGCIYIPTVALRSRADVCGAAGLAGFVPSSLHRAADIAYANPDRTVVYCIEEFDRSDPAAAVCLNPVLSDRVLPKGEDTVPVPDNLLVVATGNTDGTGFGDGYAAYPVDGSVMDRFVVLRWEADPEEVLDTVGDPYVRSVLERVHAWYASKERTRGEDPVTYRTAATLNRLVSLGVPPTQALGLVLSEEDLARAGACL